MLRAAVWIIAVLTILAGNVSSAVAEKRVALVIGNSAYEHSAVLIAEIVSNQGSSPQFSALNPNSEPKSKTGM